MIRYHSSRFSFRFPQCHRDRRCAVQRQHHLNMGVHQRPAIFRRAPGRCPFKGCRLKRKSYARYELFARYLSQLDSADRQGETVPEAKITRLNEKIATLRQEIQRLNALNIQMMQTEDKQISLTDPDARSMATSGRGSGMVGYNVQSAVDTKHHLIVAHEVTNVGSDRSQLSHMTERARAAIGSEAIDAVADRGYYNGEEIVACEQAGITVYLPKPMTSGLLAKGRFGKQDFVYVAADDVYLCPAGEQLTLSLHQ